jgi:mannose-6-phosphate isomerase-like protein (cupin superfamily)
MKRFTAAVAVAVAATAVVVASLAGVFSSSPAYATPGLSFSSTVVARGSLGSDLLFGTPTQTVVTRNVSFKSKGRIFRRSVKVTVPSIKATISCDATTPCDTAFQSTTVPPGGASGWHIHPGATFVAVAQGEGTLYNVTGSTCTATKVAAGSGFIQLPTNVHEMRNEGSGQLVIYTMYVLPHGTANTGIRVDQPQPTQCPDIH